MFKKIIRLIFVFLIFAAFCSVYAETTIQEQNGYAEKLNNSQKKEINKLSQEIYGKNTFDEDGKLIKNGPGSDGIDGPITEAMRKSIYSESQKSNSCSYDGDYSSSLNNCFGDANLVKSGNLEASTGFKDFILKLVRIISSFFSILAVFAIVVGSFNLVISTGDDEKIKKAKDIVKWAILGFLVIVSSSAIITLVIEVLYSI